LASGLVTWVANAIFVTAPEVGSTDSSIQQAVDAVPLESGWTVNVEAGVYEEQVYIAKELTLLGQGDDTVVQAPAVMSLVSSFVYGLTRQSVITVEGAEDVTIQSLKVDGDGRGNTVVSGNDFHGIGIHNASVVIDSVTVTGVRDST